MINETQSSHSECDDIKLVLATPTYVANGFWIQIILLTFAVRILNIVTTLKATTTIVFRNVP